MKLHRNLIFYIVTICGCSLLMWWIVRHGQLQEVQTMSSPPPTAVGADGNRLFDVIRTNVTHSLAILLLQIVTIMVAVALFGAICRSVGQPAVVGEILAGIVLGPSLAGTVFPELSAFLFPPQSLGNLQFLSQIGLILFMFIIGMELDLTVLKNQAREAVIISHASIIFPFTLGMGLAYHLYRDYAPPGVQFLSFALFMGIAMSITAFPVLARIIQERNMAKTRLGTIVLTCGAADDITAWSLLAGVIAIVQAGSFVNALYTLALAAAYVAFMLRVLQPFLRRLGDVYSSPETLSKPRVAIFFITLLLSSYAAESIGIHALFGAFMAGVIMPANLQFRSLFIEKVEDISVVLLLPLFFVFTGLRTQIGLLHDTALWQVCGMVVAVAVIGKFVGSAVAAKFVGQGWRESLIIGALMNTRGLMELVVLNIGYDLGIITPELFAMMVIMALATTVMTGPALGLIDRLLPPPALPASQVTTAAGSFSILISFANPERGRNMVRLANSLVPKIRNHTALTVLHLSPSNELHPFNAEAYEHESFDLVKVESQRLNLPMTMLFKPSNDVDKEIIATASVGRFDLLIIGIGQSIYEGTLLGRILGFTTKIISPERIIHSVAGKERLFEQMVFDKRTTHILKSAKIPVGVFVDKNLMKLETAFVPFFSGDDACLLAYIEKLVVNGNVRVVVGDVAGTLRQHAELRERIAAIGQKAPGHVTVYDEQRIDPEFLRAQDLMLISMESWKKAVETHGLWLSHSPSVLILRP